MKKYTHLNKKEREILYDWLHQGLKQYQIAKRLWRDPWTISRELERNRCLLEVSLNNNPQEKCKKENYHYLPDRAECKYKARKKESWKQKPILKNGIIFSYVVEQLKYGYSPEIISWRLEYETNMKISHEAIYQFIYNREFKHLKLWEYLPRQRKKRRWYSWRKMKRTLIPNRIDISERPEDIDNRKTIWHWEWDSIEWKRWTGWCLHVSVERYSRLTRIRKLNRKRAKLTNSALMNIFSEIPQWLRKSITFDNWSEFTAWEKLNKEIWIDCYFTHPYSSWEKWTVERINGFIRRFLPKGTDFNDISPEYIKNIEDWINNRPMNCLWFKTPNEVFNEHLNSLI